VRGEARHRHLPVLRPHGGDALPVRVCQRGQRGMHEAEAQPRPDPDVTAAPLPVPASGKCPTGYTLESNDFLHWCLHTPSEV
jgi:hypothetical protein